MALKLVVFDLDGTLLAPMLDFDAIRQEIGLPPETTILEGMNGLSEAERARASAILNRHEAEAAARSRLMPGAEALLAGLRQRGIKIAILTRNSRDSVERARKRHGLVLDAAVVREDMKPKPSPEGVRHLMEVCGTGPDETIVVGDFRFDIEAGAAAGCRTIAIVWEPVPPWAAEAPWTARGLDEVGKILARV